VRAYHDKDKIIPQYETLLHILTAAHKWEFKTFKEKLRHMKLASLLPRQLRRLKEMSQENRVMQTRLAVLEHNIGTLERTDQQYAERLTALEGHVEQLATLERHRAEQQQEIAVQQELPAQQVRFLVAENIRLNQLLRELIYLNRLKRSYTGSQTKESFDYQWREVGAGQWMPSNLDFLRTIPDLIVERTQLPKEWFPDKRVLDAGCGSGRWTYGLLKLGARVTACDQSQGGLAATRALVEGAGLGPGKFYQKDLLKLDLEPNSFDLVWCFGVAHHTENPIHVLKNLSALVVPGGWLFMMLYGFPESVDAFRAQAMYEEWRRRLLPLSFTEKVDILKQHYPPELVHGYFDAYSPPINDLFTWEWIQNFFQNEGFDSVHRTIPHPNHHFVARKIR
jgi:SAM-dependent methyltransferase